MRHKIYKFKVGTPITIIPPTDIRILHRCCTWSKTYDIYFGVIGEIVSRDKEFANNIHVYCIKPFNKDLEKTTNLPRVWITEEMIVPIIVEEGNESNFCKLIEL